MVKNRPRIKPRIHEWMARYSCIREKFVDGLGVRLASLREPHKGVILQSATGEELRPLFGRTLDAVPFIVSQGKMQVMKYLGVPKGKVI